VSTQACLLATHYLSVTNSVSFSILYVEYECIEFIRRHTTILNCTNSCLHTYYTGGTAAAAPPSFRPGNPALCGSCPLVTPYYCRLGDLLCYSCTLYLSTILCVCMCFFCFLSVFCVVFLYSFLLQYFDTVGWVL